MSENNELQLPYLNDDDVCENRSIDLSDNDRTLVIVGANGSGKTRLGAWLELQSPHKGRVHRVAAQKSLKLPQVSRTMSLEAAQMQFEYGNYQERYTQSQYEANMISWKYQNDPYTFLQNDYDKLLTLLFTEDYEKSTQYRQDALHGNNQAPPSTNLDKIKNIWDIIFPHRQLNIGAGEIRAKIRNDDISEYHAAKMSDGERVVIYLIGHCLVAKDNSIIIIDEPEIHLHKAIQSRLWDEVETLRPDCIFIYITHDLDFAQTRSNAKKIWLKEYVNNCWRWEVLPNDNHLPENLFLEVLGSRKPIIFVEGERGKWDDIVFSSLYKDYTIKPVGGYSSVINATRTFNEHKALHNLDCYGIIDRDQRKDQEVERLQQKNIFCLDVLEIENLMLNEDIISYILKKHLYFDDSETNEKIQSVKAKVFELLEQNKERITSFITASRIEEKLRRFDNKSRGKEKLTASLQSTFDDININEIYDEVCRKIEQALQVKDYSYALKIYHDKGKGLMSVISPLLELSNNRNNCGYKNLLKRLFQSNNNSDFLDIVKQVIGINGIP